VEYARKIGQTGSKAADVEEIDGEVDEKMAIDDTPLEDGPDSEDDDVEELGKKHKKKKGHKKKHRKASKEWYTFVRRAFVSTMTPHEIKQVFSAAEELEETPQEILEL
jgi:endopolyphosphatase